MDTESAGPQDAPLAFASRLEAETGRPVRWREGLRRELLLKTTPPVLSSFCYFCIFLCRIFLSETVFFRRKWGLTSY